MPSATFKIPVENLPRLIVEIIQLEKRAAKLEARGHLIGREPIRLEIIQEVREVGKTYWTIDGNDRYEKCPLGGEEHKDPDKFFSIVQVQGAAPRIAGWEFVAVLVHTEAGTLTRTVPTADLASDTLVPYRNVSSSCRHCGLKRRRTETFVVRHLDGRLLQVGRNCLVDFLGHDSPDDLAEYATFLTYASDLCRSAEEEEWSQGGGGGSAVAALETVMALTVTSIRTSGWLSRTKAQAMAFTRSTADIVWSDGLFPHPALLKRDRLYATKEDAELALALLGECRTNLEGLEQEERLGDYEHNLLVVLRLGYVNAKTIGLAASLVPYGQKLRSDTIKKRESTRFALTSKHFGTVKERTEFTAVLTAVLHFDGEFGVTHLHKFLTADGSSASWFASSLNFEKRIGEQLLVTATVKQHKYWTTKSGDRIAETVLTRADVRSQAEQNQREIALLQAKEEKKLAAKAKRAAAKIEKAAVEIAAVECARVIEEF